MKVPNFIAQTWTPELSLSRLQNEGSQLSVYSPDGAVKSIKATE